MSSYLPYHPVDGSYVQIPRSIYSQYYDEEMPGLPVPCRKYHISSDVGSARTIANLVLPYLVQRQIHHKVVSNFNFLIEQTIGHEYDQAGKFITVYMDSRVDQQNEIMETLNRRFEETSGIRPCESWPTRRRRKGEENVTREYEEPVYRNRQGVFIFGGFICDPLN
ncbi:MAG: hypothetical protein H6970_13785 [Gammaproteobacteria bacterium]|nr:hypothetical protein [Gammaproteobacteria bacterium]MCP5426119.1 hypothetical protein [Gammaproteobacteria bacterium]